MIFREHLELREYQILSNLAAKSAESKGRNTLEEKCDLRTDFQRDRDRIIHSKALRRLMHKTQVFLSPEGDHFRTRLTHTLEVSQISRTVSRALGLNEDLTEAIAMGHDLGHTPFGHNGEDSLAKIHPGGFRHNEQSLRVVDILENIENRRGMNLTFEVRDGILNHTGPVRPITLEGQVVKICDRVAYINHDIDDAIRGEIIKESDLPKDSVEVLGANRRARINTLVMDLVKNSDSQSEIRMSEAGSFHMEKLRAYMFKNVYRSSAVKKDEELEKIEKMIESLYRFYCSNPSRLPKERENMIVEFGVAEVVKDHIASMTDRYAMNDYVDLFLPKGWK